MTTPKPIPMRYDDPRFRSGPSHRSAVTDWVLDQIAADEPDGAGQMGLGSAQECAEAREIVAAFQELLRVYCDREGIERWVFR